MQLFYAPGLLRRTPYGEKMTKNIIKPWRNNKVAFDSFGSPEKMKLTVIAISTSAYARMFQLWFKVKDGQKFAPGEEQDFKRLMKWYKNLGEERKDKLDKWIFDLSRDVEDVTGKSGRIVDDANKRAMKEVTDWESNQ